MTVATTARVPGASLRDASVFVSHPVSSIASVYIGGKPELFRHLDRRSVIGERRCFLSVYGTPTWCHRVGSVESVLTDTD